MIEVPNDESVCQAAESPPDRVDVAGSSFASRVFPPPSFYSPFSMLLRFDRLESWALVKKRGHDESGSLRPSYSSVSGIVDLHTTASS